MKLLEVNDLSISFPQQGKISSVVKSLNFRLNSAEVLGLVGESASGKTVSAMSVMRLLPENAIYSSGNIFFYEDSENKVDLLKISDEKMRAYRGAKISMIFQEPMSSLNPLLTCGFQAGEGLLAHGLCAKNELKDKVSYWFEKVGLTEVDRVYKAYPHQLSGGQLQRVLIALALVCQPKIVIADEPTTALDVSIQRKIIDLLLSLKQELDLSMIFISHDLNVINLLADRVLVMKDGEKVEENATSELFQNPQHYYTQGLIHSRPPISKKIRILPTVQDFLKSKDVSRFYDDTNVIHSTEQDRKVNELKLKPVLLQVEKLNVKYVKSRNWWGTVKEEHHALVDFGFSLYPNEVIGLVGESGSGKSTAGKALLQLIPSSSGTVRYGSKYLDQLSPGELRPLRKELQIIFQDPYSSLNPRIKIGEAITEPMMVHGIGKNRKERVEQMVQLLEEVGLEADHAERYPHQFSGGQRQRICIARCLGLKPKFIVCDEAVSALDVSVQAQVLNLLQTLKEKHGLSYLFITHDLSVVNFIADRILVLKNGRIVEQGKTYEIMNSPRENYTKQLLEAIPHLV